MSEHYERFFQERQRPGCTNCRSDRNNDPFHHRDRHRNDHRDGHDDHRNYRDNHNNHHDDRRDWQPHDYLWPWR